MKNTKFITTVLLATAATVSAFAGLEESIDKGAAFLLKNQNAEGYWSDKQMPALTALPVWALAGTSHCTPSDSRGLEVSEAVKKGVKYVLSTQRPDGGFYVPKPGRGGSGLGNYNTSVCLSALFDTGIAPTEAMLKAREYIASSQLIGDDTMAGGFGYDKISRRRYADLSNTSYALSAMAKTAALEEHRTTGKRVDLDWDKAIAFVENLMKKDGPDAGGAAYNERTPQAGSETNKSGKVALRAYGSMTYAAVLSMCSAKLTPGDPRVRQSLEYMEKNWSVDENPGMGNQGLYYFYDIMARALAATGLEKVGDHEWKKELSAKLIALQKEDGSWSNDNNRFWESDPVLCTSFALLVLELCR